MKKFIAGLALLAGLTGCTGTTTVVPVPSGGTDTKVVERTNTQTVVPAPAGGTTNVKVTVPAPPAPAKTP